MKNQITIPVETWHEVNLPCGCMTVQRTQPYQYDGIPTFMYKCICDDHQKMINAALEEIRSRDSMAVSRSLSRTSLIQNGRRILGTD